MQYYSLTLEPGYKGQQINIRLREGEPGDEAMPLANVATPNKDSYMACIYIVPVQLGEIDCICMQ